MRFSHKIRKLFSPDLLASAWEHAGRALHPVNSKRILATIDREKMNQLRDKYPYKPNSPRINRFEDADYWVAVNVERAQDLWLDRTRPLQILDLGCGAGFFLYICRLFGHNALGLDKSCSWPRAEARRVGAPQWRRGPGNGGTLTGLEIQ